MAESARPREFEEVPDLSDAEEDVEDAEEDALWLEDEDSELQQVLCLFCDVCLCSVAQMLEHFSSDHSFSLSDVITKHRLDDYGFIQMINFTRSTKCSSSFLSSLQDAPLPWDSEHFLRPVLQDDPLLQTDPEELCASGPSHSSSTSHDALLQRAIEAEERARRAEEALTRAMDDLHKLKLLAQGLVLNAESTPGGRSLGAVCELREEEDHAYFSSYSHYSIHAEMLKVRAPTLTTAFMQRC
ncbi:protein arginine N-methyltransferase 3-like [Eucyclogobius newberryi]|uniref:protein arginine N-methyltransferase 3-like n=1 Tax=Eucyclogobius newberryi TaxID=166745 RepID=UPI003B5AFFB1